MKIHSIYFDINQIYFANLESNEKGLFLNYINSSTAISDTPIDLENLNNYPNIKEELLLFCQESPKADSIAITLASENVLISYIPGDINMEHSKIKQMIELEISNTYSDSNINNYTVIIYDFAERMDGNKMMIAAIIPNIILQNIYNILKPLQIPISKIDISPFATINSLLYNYPNQKEKAAAVLNLHNEYIDVVVVKEAKPIYYSQVYFDSIDELDSILEEEFNTIMTDYIDYVETAFFCGNYLTVDILAQGEAKLADFLMTGFRLNTFKMVRTNLEQREKEYCSRTAHIYTPCIGAILPNDGNVILFQNNI